MHDFNEIWNKKEKEIGWKTIHDYEKRNKIERVVNVGSSNASIILSVKGLKAEAYNCALSSFLCKSKVTHGRFISNYNNGDITILYEL